MFLKISMLTYNLVPKKLSIKIYLEIYSFS